MKYFNRILRQYDKNVILKSFYKYANINRSTVFECNFIFKKMANIIEKSFAKR